MFQRQGLSEARKMQLFDIVKSVCKSHLCFQFHFYGSNCFEACHNANVSRKFIREKDTIHSIPAIPGRTTKALDQQSWSETLAMFKQWLSVLDTAH